MGRVRGEVPRGKFRLRVVGKPLPEKFYQVNIEYTWNATIIRKATDVKSRIADWNPKGNLGRGELRPSYGGEYKRTNALLNKHLDKIDADLLEYNEKHPLQITIDVIKGLLQDKPLMRKDEGKDFAEFALERLTSKYSRNKIGHSRYKNGVSALRMFGEFLISRGLGTHKENGIFVGEMTCELLQAHIDWRRQVKQNDDKTINHALTPILSACDYACNLGFIDKTKNAALQDMRIDVKPNIDEDSRKYDGRSLSKTQLQELVRYYDDCNEPRRKEFLEMFLFAFHACGLRVADVMTLQWSSVDFQKKELSKILVKTKNRHTIPLTEPAITILKHWKEKNKRKRFVCW
ncbi:MAG: tyrosine-type recombinase/integrase [Prevotella sp.]|nr:tyrosine-type recombinase/integrase [Prevotella sp.]